MRCIDADELIEFFDGFPDYVEFDVEDIKSIINEQDTADVVEVVRCKDCKHYVLRTLFGHTQGWCERLCDKFDRSLAHGTEEDDYCSFGERAEQ